MGVFRRGFSTTYRGGCIQERLVVQLIEVEYSGVARRTIRSRGSYGFFYSKAPGT